MSVSQKTMQYPKKCLKANFSKKKKVQTLYIYSKVMVMQLSTSLIWNHPKNTWKCSKISWLSRCGIAIIDTDSLNLKIHVHVCQKHREYFGTTWSRGNVRCVYSKHNNGKARSRKDRGTSPSLCKEYFLKTRQTIQVCYGKLNTSN